MLGELVGEQGRSKGSMPRIRGIRRGKVSSNPLHPPFPHSPPTFPFTTSVFASEDTIYKELKYSNSVN